LAVQGFNLFAKSAVKMATNRSDGLPREIAAGLLAPYNSWSNRIATYEFVADIPTTPKQKTWQTLESIERRLKTLRQKKLLIWGMRDWCFRPECLDRFLKHWPDAEVERLADAGHYVLLDQPDTVISRVERFLES
jgi:haloalkane dehalogenase